MSDEKIQAFLNEMTELSIKHGLALNDTGEVWEMEPDDYNRKYQLDELSVLHFEGRE